MAVDLSAVHFEGRSTAYRLVQSPVILALLDQERLPQLAAEHAAASRVAAKACILAGQSATDLTEMIDAGIKDGTDPAELLDQFVKVRADANLRREAAGMLANVVDRYRDNLAYFIEDQAFDLIDTLSDRLEDLLDRARVTVAELGDARDADAALYTDRGAEWKQLRVLHQEYQELRTAHLALLIASDGPTFGPGSDAVAFAFWISPLRAWPGLAAAHHAHIRRDGFDVRGVPGPAWDLTDPSSLEHFLAAVTRPELGACVLDAEAADAAWRAAIKDAAPNEFVEGAVGGELTRYYGSEAGVAARHIPLR